MAVLAGIVDAIGGGGGLVTVPGLLMVGVPPLTALGTNRLQAVIGELASFLTYIYYREIRSEQIFLVYHRRLSEQFWAHMW